MLSMGLFALVCISIFAYASLTFATIFETAGKTRATARASALTSHISEIEAAYLSLSNNATAAEASSRGFVTPKKVTLVTPRSSGASLSVSTR